MFKFIFEILTDPLGLPIEWYWEYLILAVIGAAAYAVAYRCVGDMYSGGETVLTVPLYAAESVDAVTVFDLWTRLVQSVTA